MTIQSIIHSLGKGLAERLRQGVDIQGLPHTEILFGRVLAVNSLVSLFATIEADQWPPRAVTIDIHRRGCE